MVHVVHVGQKELSCDIYRGIRAVHVNLFVLAVVCAQANYVALVGGNKDQLVLAEESKDRRVGLSRPVAGLDRKCEVLVIAEVEAQNRMAYPADAPIYEEKIDSAEVGKIVCPVAPAVGVFGFGAIVAVSDVVDCDLISSGFRPRLLSDVCAPGAFACWFKTEPP